MLDAATLEAITQEARTAFLEEDAPLCLTLLLEGLPKLEIAIATDQSTEYCQPIYKNLGRAAHSLKGGAGMAVMPTLNQLCHRMEDLFEALEQGRVEDNITAFGLLSLATEEVQTLIDAAIAGQTDNQPEQLEITVALEQFLETLGEAGEIADNHDAPDSFIAIALGVELESCLVRVEKLLPPENSDNALQQSFKLLQEESTLLGQALNCAWLEAIITLAQQIQASQKVPLRELIPVVISEIRQLRENYFQSEPTEISENLRSLLPQVVVETPEVPQAPIQPVIPAKPAVETGSKQNLRIPLERLNKMSNTVSELLINHERLLISDRQLRQASRNLKKRNQQLIPMREQVESLYDELSFREQPSNIPITTQNGQNSLLEEFDALEFDQYTTAHTTLQRFQELMVQVQEIHEDVDLIERELQETLLQVRQSLDSLDGDLNQSRLVPFSTLANAFIQPVEKLSQRQLKSAQLVIEGENVLVELAILEQLRTPLTHLIRNAFDHGIELPRDRVSVGKPEIGQIKISAVVTSNQVRITVADDGNGIPLNKVRQRAIALGLITTDANPSREEVLDYIFTPSFSTADSVSDLSGRGLGLDIVKNQVEMQRGSLKVETEAGKGTRFIIRIPLTLNIVSILLVRCQQQLLAFPSESVTRIISLTEFPIVHGQVTWQEQSFPVRSLEQLLPYNIPNVLQLNPQNRQSTVGLMLPINDKIAVVTVDQIVDERQLVFKAFDLITPIPNYLAGCTVLGTGEVVPILLPEYFDELWQKTEVNALRPSSSPSQAFSGIDEGNSILVIDDSIMVRRTLTRILTRSDYQVMECRDGKEAWELLIQHLQNFKLILCDLEMPNMDGFSLLQLIRADETFNEIPVVVLTSRESEMHRQRAMSLGANAYVTKPFQPNLLLETIADLIATSKIPV
jgi:type IV pili sensor histidine kinase/response regulator